MTETQTRSLVKAISWRCVGTIDTFVVSWFITGQVMLAGSIAALEVITKIVLFWTHERCWNRVGWGKAE